ncbi:MULTISPECIES: 3-phenylpropionate/cinnamic acid dioxygenase subunit beta [unclassified Paenibacillus]|uniref:aromatic-ring-hydroxylating dioxygenase subunit beta n=1 Tax=unclassified Paenibacillus TaxID=185978 RepID=UPI001AE27B82|nr:MULTISPECIES: 3-phenylpropionate/cinnamic acid dioxygenase subunit beta [unclassified Paenibacillus]MBP1157313.1 3-phenylpropionate/cinnamic acid dioxygenase small subunit [Paenibacillus sp. PvP091]MBP1171948.1 3-phenylpropionate/cinnamic acid dioxygenase small subunit [Paenibacillus sp. PvR098]MBP2438329.1 3-phenylpropionate/cinnamic acid dioxygenase small subunit [Paenibacillus sp. PvP052]
MLSTNIRIGNPIYFEILEFLQSEAEVLDSGEFRKWLDMLDQEMHYVMPVRTNRERIRGEGFIGDMYHFEENYASMKKRIERVETEFAWAEDPPSRTRRFISNVRVEQTAEHEFKVKSYLLLTRSRGNEPDYNLVTCVRNDILTRTGQEFKLKTREILIDQTTLGMDNLAVFF